jgi:RimJ/RimL family protein N-acetyltransferase
LRLASPVVEPIRTERLILEPWAEAHREPFRRMTLDPAVVRHVAHGKPWEEELYEARFQAGLTLNAEHGYGRWAIVEADTGAWAGLVMLQPFGPGLEGVDPEAIEAGWWIEPALWGRGYAPEAVQAVVELGFAVGLDRIWARIYPENAASQRVAAKLGMRPEGTARNQFGVEVGIYVLDRPA